MSQNAYDPRPAHAADTPVQPPPLPSAPPTVPGALGRAPSRPTWPIVLGIVSVVLGAFGLMQNLWGLASMFMLNAFSGFMPPDGPNPMDAVLKWRIPLSITYTFASIASLLLLIGGVLLLLRKPAASPGLVCWALLKIPVTFALTTFTLLMQIEQIADMAAAAGPGGAAMTGFGTPFMILFGVLWVLWGVALPVFVLIWFTRMHVRSVIQEWRDEHAAFRRAR